MSTEFPSPQDWVDHPLYFGYDIPRTGEWPGEFDSYVTDVHRVDIFCPYCNQFTVIVGGSQTSPWHKIHDFLNRGTFQKLYSCSRDNDHVFQFFFVVQNWRLTKVGQFPALADIENGVIRPYSKVLDKQQFGELSRAVGLAAHGVGIGSFVYLRRIFERLIEEAATRAATEHADWDSSKFINLRMDEKIRELSDYLPGFLVENRSMYSILSSGIHTLSEEECLTHFPVVQAGTELILDEKVAQRQREKKLEDAKKKIGMISQSLSSKSKK